MKTNSTCPYIVFFTIAIFCFTFNKSQAQCVAPGMKFVNPVLISGTAGEVNAKYKFSSVISGVDAIVKITGKVNGATLTSIDDTTYGYSEAWQPVVKTHSTQAVIESYISFKVDFVESTDSSEHVFICFTLSAIDVDGDAVHVREMVAANDFTNYGVSNVTTLTLTNQSGLLKATSSITNYPGIDTSAFVTNINYNYISKSKITELRIGCLTDDVFTVQDRYSCIYFKPITIKNVVLLPAQYFSLNTSGSDKNIVLNWQTNEETDNSSFSIERSFNGSNFSPIVAVIERTKAENLKSYQAIDNSEGLIGKSQVYYRVKQVSKSGQANYSNLSYVHLQNSVMEKMKTSPNPFTDKINVQFSSTDRGIAELHIADLTGTPVMQKKVNISNGVNHLSIDGLALLTPGVYMARLTMNGRVIETKKIIK